MAEIGIFNTIDLAPLGRMLTENVQQSSLFLFSEPLRLRAGNAISRIIERIDRLRRRVQIWNTGTRAPVLYLTVFLLAVLLRSLFLIFIDTPILFYKYPFFAERLASGADIGDRLVDLSPFYLYLLAFLRRFFGIDWHDLKVLQGLIGAFNCLLILKLGTLVFNKKGRAIGFLAAFLYAAYGNLIVLETTLEPEIYVLLFNLLCILSLHSAGERFFSFRHILFSGIFAGLSIITKANSLLILPLGILWLLFSSSSVRPFSRRVSAACLFAGSALLIVFSVTARNYVKLNDIVLVTADAGKVFYHGNGKGASALEGTGLPDEGFAEEGAAEPDYAHVLFRKTANWLSGKALSPSEASKFWFQKTLEDIRSDFNAYAIRQMKKLFYFFNDYEMHDVASAYLEYKRVLSLPAFRFGIISALGLTGMLFSLKGFRHLFLIYGMVCLYIFSGLLFLMQSRYRTPAVPYLCLFAGAAVFKLREFLIAKKLKTAALSILLVCFFWVLGNWIYRGEIVRTDRWQTATRIYYQMEALPLFKRGHYGKAVVNLDRCLALEPNFAPAYNLRGKILAVTGDYGSSERDFKQVIRLSPDMAEGFKNIGFLYLLKGDRTKAAENLSKAAALAPGDLKVQKAINELR
ncbi:MAG: hypothetical protein C4530_13100 [Desulfobacteraceae bacterium]|nr:MAG: hypothetical protein C4530_13100 [Desulfobacteraceae bacterium]